MAIEPFEENSAEDLARNGKKCYASLVVTFAEVTLLRKVEYEALAPVLWDDIALPYLGKEICQHHGGCGDICL